jgi:hypothetical protein
LARFAQGRLRVLVLLAVLGSVASGIVVFESTTSSKAHAQDESCTARLIRWLDIVNSPNYVHSDHAHTENANEHTECVKDGSTLPGDHYPPVELDKYPRR